VGGGLIGIELAEMLRSRNIPVFLSTRKKFWDGVLPLAKAK
jgi:pyruvate/2-oxoglutarate dehydrogenase complex dihydrolipoamide dehydrogenase (E3) component